MLYAPVLLAMLCLGLAAMASADDADDPTPTQPDGGAFPSVPDGPFGATYCRLDYGDEWDAQWRVEEHADLVVRFDDQPFRLMFWRGTNYIACWATENGIWYSNEFLETSGGGTEGCCEPISDRQCRYSHVRVIENHDARVVVHWRYALVDVHYGMPHVDPETGWADWGDEYYTVYPDGVCVRRIVLHSSAMDAFHEFQETIVLNPPGTRPEDNIATEALTLANMAGETHTYSWDPCPDALDRPDGANIMLVNLKAENRPFAIVDPVDCSITTFGGHNPESIFNAWDHWPVSLSEPWITVAPDFTRPTHSSLSHMHWRPVEETERSVTKLLLNGMTPGTAGELVPLAKSWLSPPQCRAVSGGIDGVSYESAERAYVVTPRQGTAADAVELALDASEDQPVVNPCFVARGWGDASARLRIDGEPKTEGADFRIGHVRHLEGTDIVVWIRMEASAPVAIALERSAP